MGETVSVDGKGRLVLPKGVREKARIGVNVKLIARARGVGKVELSDPMVVIEKAQEIGARKLARWKEEEHKATSYVLNTMKEKRNETP